MFFRHIGRGCAIFGILGFVIGLMMAFFLPPLIIAVVECVLIIVLCICLCRGRKG